MAVLRDRVFKSQHFNSFQLPDQQLYFDSLVEGFSIFSGLLGTDSKSRKEKYIQDLSTFAVLKEKQ